MDVNINERKLKQKIENILSDDGFDLVEFSMFFSKGLITLRCAVDYPCGGITLDTCAAINRRLSDYLYESGELGEEFSLEVNSPGMKRKLRSYKDFLRVRGRTLCLWLKQDMNGKDYYEGELVALDRDYLVIRPGKGDLKINFSYINVGKEKIL